MTSKANDIVKVATMLLEQGETEAATEILETLTEKGAATIRYPHQPREAISTIHVPRWAYKHLTPYFPKDAILQRRGPAGKGVKVEATESEVKLLVHEIDEVLKQASFERNVTRGLRDFQRSLQRASFQKRIGKNTFQHTEKYLQESIDNLFNLQSNLRDTLRDVYDYLQEYGPDQNLSLSYKLIERIEKNGLANLSNELPTLLQLIQKIKNGRGESGYR